MEPFRVQAIDGPDRVTVRIAGEVDVASAAPLAEAFARALATDRDVVVDCSQVTFIDRTGLTALSEARDLARKCRVGFHLASVPEQLRPRPEPSDTTLPPAPTVKAKNAIEQPRRQRGSRSPMLLRSCQRFASIDPLPLSER